MRGQAHRILLRALAASTTLALGVALLAGCDTSESAALDLDEVRRTGVPPDAEPARVVHHVDGDTLRVEPLGASRILPGGETPVRLLEIDAPEMSHEDGDHECYAEAASDALATLLPEGARVLVVRDAELRDQYDRTLLYLWTEDGVFVNEELVRLGFAGSVLFEPNDRHIDRMRAAEQESRDAGRGLWGAC